MESIRRISVVSPSLTLAKAVLFLVMEELTFIESESDQPICLVATVVAVLDLRVRLCGLVARNRWGRLVWAFDFLSCRGRCRFQAARP